MTTGAAPTFRDFASQIFAGDLPSASSTLEILLAVSPERARSAAEHFQKKTSDPSFLPKAMSLRTAVTSGNQEEIGALLAECFGLSGEEARTSALALDQRYGAPKEP
jgi:hypothetical protein